MVEHQLLKTGLFSQRNFDTLFVINIRVGARHQQRFALRVIVGNLTPLVKPPPFAALMQHAAFKIVVLSMTLQAIVQQSSGCLAVFRVHGIKQGIYRQRPQLVKLVTKHIRPAGVELHALGRDFPFPGASPGSLYNKTETLFIN